MINERWHIISVFLGEPSDNGVLEIKGEHVSLQEFAGRIFNAMSPDSPDDEHSYYVDTEIKYDPNGSVIFWKEEIEGDETLFLATFVDP